MIENVIVKKGRHPESDFEKTFAETSPWQPDSRQFTDSRQSINDLSHAIKIGDSFKFFIRSNCFYAWGSAEHGNIVNFALKGSRESIKAFHKSNPDLFKLENYSKGKS